VEEPPGARVLSRSHSLAWFGLSSKLDPEGKERHEPVDAGDLCSQRGDNGEALTLQDDEICFAVPPREAAAHFASHLLVGTRDPWEAETGSAELFM
jgi:hypothetical protein